MRKMTESKREAKIRSRSRSTSTHVTKDDDIKNQVRLLRSIFPQIQRLKVHQVKEGREVQELFQELSKEREEGQRQLRNSQQNLTDRTQDLWRGQECRGCQKWFGEAPWWRVGNSAYLVTPIRRGGPLERMLQWKVTRRWLDHKMAQAAWVADGAASVEVAAECISCQKSRPRGRWRARWQCQFGTYWPRGTADISRMRTINWADGGGEKLHRLVRRKLRAWTRRLRTWTWPGCVRRRSRDHPHRWRQDQMRDTQQQSFNATILLQRGEGGHHMQEN